MALLRRAPELLFTENETNTRRLFGSRRAGGYFKDGINDAVVDGRPTRSIRRGAARRPPPTTRSRCRPAARVELRLRLTDRAPSAWRRGALGERSTRSFAQRQAEADEFYATVDPRVARAGRRARDAAGARRHAVVEAVLPLRRARLAGRRSGAAAAAAANGFAGRNQRVDASLQRRRHLDARQVGVPVVRGVGPGVSLHAAGARRSRSSPSSSSCCCCASGTCIRTGSCPPTSGRSATSTRRCTPGPPGASTRSTRSARGVGDRAFLERIFQKLLLNFTWWVNRKDAEGKNVFQGGFLGLDNIGVFDRSAPLPTGGHLEQSDGTSWMAMYCLNMLAIALELAEREPGLRGCRQQVLGALSLHRPRHATAATTASTCGTRRTASSTTCCTCRDGEPPPLKVRSMVGLIPLFAVETIEPRAAGQAARFKRRMEWFIDNRPDLTEQRGLHAHAGARRAPPALDRRPRPAAAGAAA